MKYRNAVNVLPAELIEELQEYVQGEYIYIPIRERNSNNIETDYKIELQKRNEHIFSKSLEGISKKSLAIMYSLSESSIRRIIIEQRGRYKDMEQSIKDILCKWGIKNTAVKQIYDTAWKVGEDYVLKVYKSMRMLERNIKVTTILSDKGIPVSKIIPTVTKCLFTYDGAVYYILFEKLHGGNVVNLKGNSAIAYDMGKIIAELHIAFRECEKQEVFDNNSLLEEMKGWIQKSFIKDNWNLVDKNKFEETLNQLDKLYCKLPVQLIHRDVHFGNFLFDGNKFSGYIDFDLSQKNIRIFDLCYFVIGLLSEEEKLELSYDEWFVILKNVFRGYEVIDTLNYYEKCAVPSVMKSIELLFVAWFINQKDFKCAEDAMKLFEFVDMNTEKILKCIM